MESEERLNKFMAKGGVSFSYGYEDCMHFINMTRIVGSKSDSVGGSFGSFDEGINFCIDHLEKVSRKRIIKEVKKA